MNKYTSRVLEDLKSKYSYQPEFIQAAEEVLTCIEPVIDAHPEYEKAAVLERLVEPERTIEFRVPWFDKEGNVKVNRGYRIQYSSAIGPYKGGLRFHPSVNQGLIKFLGFEMIFKNSLTDLPIGGGKGGSDFDPHGKTDTEVMSFCQSYMSELYKHIGSDVDIPAGDIGVGGREIGYLFGQFKRLSTHYDAATLTGKGLTYGGSLARTEATGYGIVYITEEMMSKKGKSIKGARTLVSGSGNVAQYACEKAVQLGAKVIAMSDSDGYVLDENGINLDIIKNIKQIRRARISEYVKEVPSAKYVEGCKGIWGIPCDVALPCATQNEIDLESAKLLISNGCRFVSEGANMPCTTEAVNYFVSKAEGFMPAKAANAGGVSVSALEMSQNSERLSWTFEEVDSRLKKIMINIYDKVSDAAKRYNKEGDFVSGANIASFEKIAEAMMAQGII